MNRSTTPTAEEVSPIQPHSQRDGRRGDRSSQGGHAGGEVIALGEVVGSNETLDGVDAALLRQLVEEARCAAPPELDWEKMEETLLTRVDQQHSAVATQQRRIGSSWGTVGGFAAAAAALIMVIAQTAQQPLTQPHEQAPRQVNVAALTPLNSAPGQMPTYDAAEVGVRALLTSGDKPLRIEVKGVATWVLEPNSRALVHADKAPYLVELQQGALHAKVVPRKSPNEVLETFAVEVGGTRVAVHGTVFSVNHRGDDLSVEVSRGVVTVGPGGHRGITTGHSLVAPAHATFALQGGRLKQMLEPSSTQASARWLDPNAGVTGPSRIAQTGVAAGIAPPTNAPTADDSADHSPPAKASANSGKRVRIARAEPATPSTPPPASADTTPTPEPTADASAAPAKALMSPAQARALVVGCLSSAMQASVADHTVLRVSSRMTANLDADGAVLSVRFNPPLKPVLQQRCASSLFGRRLSGGPRVSFDLQVSQSR